MTSFRQMLRRLASLRRDTSGLALIEFAYSMPLLLSTVAGGVELANYAIIKMRVTSLAVQIADNASRIGEGDLLAAKKITESQINDFLVGAVSQAGTLNIATNYSEFSGGTTTTKAKARIVISSLEPDPDPGHPNKNFIKWQRCKGLDTSYTPQYGVQGTNNMAGMGPPGRQAYAPAGTQIMFVEVHYRFEPVFLGAIGILPYKDINDIAAMIVRDDRDTSQIYNTEGAPVSSC